MTRSLALVVCLAAVAGAQAAETFRIDPARSSINFKLRHMLGTAAGKFADFAGTIDLNREHPENSSVAVRIQVKSIDTGIRKRDEHLLSDEFFNVARFPEITFKSTAVKRTDAETGDINGEFTMHGVTKQIALRAKFLGAITDNSGEITRWQITTGPLKRSDFGLVWSPTTERISMIGEEVNIAITIVAVRAK
jgi:polyisoprenoid-binding protein YceI